MASGTAIESLDVHGTRLATVMRGQGRDIVFLRGGFWLGDESPFIDALAARAHVIAPIHPGFGVKDPMTGPSSVDDLSYLYLDLMDQLALKNVILVGANFGGWIAADIAVKTCARLSGLVLIDAFGVKLGAREERDIVDLFGVPDSRLRQLGFHRPENFDPDLKTLPDEELGRRVKAREGLARYGWTPYMHNPRLKERLHRVAVPTLVLWGAEDGIVKPDYGRRYASLIPGARFDLVAAAGHMPHVEQSAAVIERILAFARDAAPARAS
jgi:pimeloyl-ACP methyl ester carboxylesterase